MSAQAARRCRGTGAMAYALSNTPVAIVEAGRSKEEIEQP